VASTYSNLKIQLMATGENSGTWGNVTNANLGDAIEQAIVETATVTFASANVTLTLSDSNSKQDARALRLNLTGTTAGARDLIVPAIQKPYLVNNGTADTITVKVSGQTGVAVPASTSMLLYNNGTDVGVAFNRVVGNVVGNVSGSAASANTLTTARTIAISGNVTGTATSFDGSGNISIPVTAIDAAGITAGTLGVARGGTAASTLTAENVIIGNGTSAVKFVAPGTSGNVLTSNGSAWLSQAISAGGNFVQQVYTSPATWTKPATIKAVRVSVGGGGGGGGGTSTSPDPQQSYVAGNGGSGGYACKYLSAPSIPGPISVTIGAGGNPGTSTQPNGAPGGTGGTSSFGPLVSATGGGGGGGSGPISPNPVNAAPGASGSGSGSDLTLYQTGADPQLSVQGIVGIRGTSNPNANGGAGVGRMSGGGGARNQNSPQKTGGAGAGGVIIVEEFY
jgi:hypothetical protein